MGDNTVLQGIRVLSLEQVHVLPGARRFWLISALRSSGWKAPRI